MSTTGAGWLTGLLKGGELTPRVCSWVVYQEPNYRGPHYVLEKRDYNSSSDWGSQSTTVGSMRRIRFN